LSVVDQIDSLKRTKLDAERRVLAEMVALLAQKAQEEGPVLEMIDLIFGITGYQSAPIPGGEAQVCGNLIAKLIQYMTLRASQLSKNTEPNYEIVQGTLRDMIGECTRLYGECKANDEER
jgi:hypothetical protein